MYLSVSYLENNLEDQHHLGDMLHEHQTQDEYRQQ
jgi:hypothetical protein